MDIKDLMEIDVTTLAETQHRELKRFVIEKLDEIAQLVEDEKYEEIKDFTVYSPAGDYMGTDTHHINFGYNGEADILEIVDELKKLKRQAAEGERYNG